MAELRVPDVSEFQQAVNWPQLVAYLRSTYGGAAAIIRLCYGDLHVDGWADRNIEGARAAGADWLAWYLYLVGGRAPAPQAATLGRILLAHGGLRPGECVVIDDEEGAGDQSGRVDEALAEFDAQLKTPNPAGEDWWYSGLDFALTHDLAAARGRRIIAAYQASEPAAIAHDLWQFTDRASLPGIAGPVDCSVFHGSITDLIQLTGGADMATIDDVLTTVRAINDQTGQMFNMLLGWNPWGPDQEPQRGPAPTPAIVAVQSSLAALQAAVGKLAQPTVDVDALAAALAPHLQPVDWARLEADLAQLPDQVRSAFAKALGASSG